MKRILIAIFAILFTVTLHLNSQVEDDCLCNLKNNGYINSGNIYVDTCGNLKICDHNNHPYYFKEFSLITENSYKFTKLDTGLLDFKNLPDSMSVIRNILNELDSKYILNEVRARAFVISSDVSLEFKISTYQTKEVLESTLIELFQPRILFFPELIALTGIKKNDYKGISCEYDIESGFVKINSNYKIMFIRIIDINGKILFNKDINNRKEVILDIRSYPRGVYYLIINNEKAINFIK